MPVQAILVKRGKGLQRSNILWYTLLCALFLFASIVSVSGVAADLHSYATVQDDATLKIQRRHIRLFGIYFPDLDIPNLDSICVHGMRPMRCDRLAQAAARALDDKIQGFVRCREQWKNRDGTVTAICVFRGQDLSAYLIQWGWALAAPYAPPHYHTFEKSARHRGRGIWGYTVYPYVYP